MNEELPNYSRVRVVTDRFEEAGAPAGTVGYVIEVYAGGAYEVEVSDPAGATIAPFVATRAELEPELPRDGTLNGTH